MDKQTSKLLTYFVMWAISGVALLFFNLGLVFGNNSNLGRDSMAVSFFIWSYILLLIHKQQKKVEGQDRKELSSILSLATVSRPSYSSAISSRMGAIILQGPHHSAQ